MGSVTFGRTIVDGTPSGEGVTVDADGPTAAILSQITSPLISNPAVGEWTAVLVDGSGTDGEYERGLAIYAAENRGPPEHVHPTYEERFEVLEGTFRFVLNGEQKILTAGEQLTVPPGNPHTFSNESDDVGSCIIETRPAGDIQGVIATLSGLAHDGKLSPAGKPRFLQGLVMAHELADDTVFTSPPPALQRLFAAIGAPIARHAGYRATYSTYLDESFWTERVEQPS